MKNGPGDLTISSGARSSSNRIEHFDDSLSDRIVVALEASIPNITSEKLSALVSEVNSSLSLLRETCEKTRAFSLDPLTPSSAVPGAVADLFESEHRIARFEKALSQLKEKHERAVAHEKEVQERETRAALEQERDALAAELCETYKAAEQIADLFARIQEFDNRARPYGVTRVEAKARNIQPHGLIRGGVTLVGWLTDIVRLPSFSPDDSVMGKDLWPKPQSLPNADVGAFLGGLTPQTLEHAARVGNEGRRIGEEVTRNRGRERNASKPSPLHTFVPVLDPDEASARVKKEALA